MMRNVLDGENGVCKVRVVHIMFKELKAVFQFCHGKSRSEREYTARCDKRKQFVQSFEDHDAVKGIKEF